jgi:RHS repeat-associated protein
MERSGGNGEIWSIRGLDGKVLREYRADVSASDYRDYVWRGGALLSKVEPQMAQVPDKQGNLVWTRTGETVEASVVDHLGTIRRFSNGAGQGQSAHSYYPFGVEQTTSTDGERLKFTGQERDTWNTTSPADDLDYFHARHYNPQLGRFLQVDPLLGSVSRPQTLNRYAYVVGNPALRIDPLGQNDTTFVDGTTVVAKDPCTAPVEISCLGSYVIQGGGSRDPFEDYYKLLIPHEQLGPFVVPPRTPPDPMDPPPPPDPNLHVNDPWMLALLQAMSKAWDPAPFDRCVSDVPGTAFADNFGYWATGEFLLSGFSRGSAATTLASTAVQFGAQEASRKLGGTLWGTLASGVEKGVSAGSLVLTAYSLGVRVGCGMTH